MDAKLLPGLLITGTDTNVGKTYVAARIVAALVNAGHRVGVYKPVSSGVAETADAGESEAWGVELESLLQLGDSFSVQTNVGYIDAEIKDVDPGTVGVAEGDTPTLTPEWTFAVGPQYEHYTGKGNRVTFRMDYSYRDNMFGQSINNSFNELDSRQIVNFLIRYENVDKDWSIAFYGDNIFDETYDVARLDQAFSGFTEIILSNDRSEFGVKYAKRFGGS